MIDRLLKAGADANAALDAGRRHGGDDGGADGQAGRDSRARRSRRQRQREGDLGRHDGADVGGVGRACRRRAGCCSSAGADVNARSHYVAAANGRGFEGRTPVASRTEPKAEEFASGWLTPLMLAAREGDVELARILVEGGRRRQRGRRRRQDGVGPVDLQRQLRGGVVPGGEQGRRQQGRRAAVHAAVLGRRSPQHGNGAEFPVDGHGRSDAAHPQAARRRRESRTRSSTTRRARGCARALRALSSPPR